MCFSSGVRARLFVRVPPRLSAQRARESFALAATSKAAVLDDGRGLALVAGADGALAGRRLALLMPLHRLRDELLGDHPVQAGVRTLQLLLRERVDRALTLRGQRSQPLFL